MAKRKRVVDGTFWFMVGVLAALSLLAYGRGGTEFLSEGLRSGADLLLRFGLVIAVSFLAAGLAEKLVPHEWVRATLGDDAGVSGLFIATGAGLITPAGPFVSMPIAAAMFRSGAGAAVVVAYLTSWSLLALHRFVAWEVPILGLRFALLRYGVCLALPILAGLLVRWMGIGNGLAVGR